MPAIAAAVPYIAAASTAASAYSSISQAQSAKKAANAAASAGQTNPSTLDSATREISRQNAIDSAALEREINPQLAGLRTRSNAGLMEGLQPQLESTISREELINLINNGGVTPLLKAAQDKAAADLALGGDLSVELQNLINRRGAERSGQVSGGLGLARDLTARDLGLTSLELENQRLNNALTAGQVGQAGILNSLQMLQGLSDNNFNRSLAAAQYAGSMPQPVVGLDPGSYASVMQANANNAQAAAANRAEISGRQSQAWANVAGQGLGYFASNYRPTIGTSTAGSGTAAGGVNPYPMASSGGFLSGARATF